MPKQSITLRLGSRRNALLVPAANSALARLGSVTVVTPPVGGSGKMRFGHFGMQFADFGTGPGGGTANPYDVAQWNPHAEGLSNLKPALDKAQQLDILLIVMVAGSAVNYGGGGNPAGGLPPRTFNLAAYTAMLDKLMAAGSGQGARLSQMLQNRTALVYFGDEPNAQTWGQGTGQPAGWNPQDWNAAARACKDRWPGCLTFGRLSPRDHRGGWGPYKSGAPYPASTYDAIDYGWLQYNHGSAVARKESAQTSLTLERNVYGSGINGMGVACSINMVNGGYQTTVDGVPACWDYSDNNVSSGVVIGEPNNAYSQGQQIPCANLPSVAASQNLLASPAEIQRLAEVWSQDPDVGFYIGWMLPDTSVNDSQVLVTPVNYFYRADWAAAFRQCQIFGGQRTTFNGYRTPKP